MKMTHENQRPLPDTSMPIHKAAPIAAPIAAPEREAAWSPPTTKMPKHQMAAPMSNEPCPCPDGSKMPPSM